MSDLPVCRACLVMDVVLYPILNLYTQEVYQHLTNLSFESPDGKPQYLCYECRSVMRRCVEFRDKCLRADGVLNQLVSSQMLTAGALSIIDRNLYKLTSNLISTPTEIISTELKYPAPIKTEADLSKDSVQDVAHNIDELDAYTRQKYDEIDEELAANDAIERTKDVMDDLKIDYQSEVSGFEANEEKMISDFEGANDSVSEDDLPLSSISRGPEAAGEVGKRKGETTCGKRAPFQAPYAKEVTLTAEEQQAEMKKRASSTNYLHSQYKCELCFKGFVDETAFKNHLDKHSEIKLPSGSTKKGIKKKEKKKVATRTSVPIVMREMPAASAPPPPPPPPDHQKVPFVSITNPNLTPEQREMYKNILSKWKPTMYPKSTKRHICNKCSKEFKTYQSLYTHARLVHSTKDSEVVCNVCKKTLKNKYYLYIHRTKKHFSDMERKLCKYCRQEFATDRALQMHVKKIHPNTLPEIKCPECGKEFKTVEKLRHHVQYCRQEDENKRTCPHCHKLYKSRISMNNHLRWQHSEDQRHTCIFCPLTFKSKYHMKEHVLNVHPPLEFKVSCPQCMKEFRNGRYLKIHMQTHNSLDMQVSCELCNKMFHTHHRLKKHKKFVHPEGEQKHQCVHCNKEFAHEYYLRRHISGVHMKTDESEWQHRCDRCEKKFKVLKYLKNHMMKHAAADETLSKDDEDSAGRGGSAAGNQEGSVKKERQEIQLIKCEPVTSSEPGSGAEVEFDSD